MFWTQARQRRRHVAASLGTAKLEVEQLEPRLVPALANPSTFTWNSISGALYYDVWVSDLTTGVSPIIRNTNVVGTSWTAFRPLNPSDTYEWWVRAISGNGVPGPWSAGIVFTVTSLPAPILMSPVGGTVQGVVATFTWSVVAGAGSYDVWVNDLASGQSQFARNTEITGTSWTPFALVTPGHSYIWWVRATDAAGGAGSWSNGAVFTVVGNGTIPGAPIPTVPTGLALVGSTVQPTYTWGPTSGADYYDLWVNDVTSGQSEVVRTQVTSLAFASRRALTSGDQYMWWVRGGNSNGSVGPWSIASTFTATLLSPPVLIGPSGPVTLSSLVLTWNTVVGASFYDIWIDDLSSGQSQVERTQVTGTSLTPTFLAVGHTFEWWVRAGTNDGGFSIWRAPLIFTITM